MHKSPLLANPFALMMEPEAVLQAIEQAQSQGRVKGRIYRPLDKPTIPDTPEAIRAFDRRADKSSLHD